jgi:hypothetical protein
MDVGLDEPRQEVPAARVDDLPVPAVGLGADRHDAAFPHHDRPFDDVEPIVHRDDGGVTDERRRHSVGIRDSGLGIRD